MPDRVKSMLANGYRMFYQPAMDPAVLTPGLQIHDAIQQANHVLARCVDMSECTELERDCLARMIRVKWILQRLPMEPIRKPILVHVEQQQLMVDCGDTRLMALDLSSELIPVSVISTCDHAHAETFSGWQEISSEPDLFHTLGMDSGSASVVWTATPDGSAWAVSWLEIGDAGTSHHLHDTQQCIDILSPQLQPGFRFSRDWFYA